MKHEALTLSIQHDHPSRRRVRRSQAVLMMGRLEADMADDLCLVCDISPLGARLKTVQPVVLGDHLTLDFGDLLKIGGTVRWCEDGYCGLEFDGAVDLAPLFHIAAHPHSPDAPAGAEGQSRRAHPRLRRCADVVIRQRGKRLRGQLFDISPVGGRIDLVSTDDFVPGDPISFTIEDRFEGEGSVRWVDQDRIGVSFDPPLRLWKLEKWLVEGLDRCTDCTADACVAPSFKRAVRKQPHDTATDTH